MADWVATEVWTEIGDTTNGCEAAGSGESGNYDGNNGTTSGTANDAACAAICANLPAWGMTSNLPTGASPASGGSAGGFTATHCYGYSFSTNDTSCTLM